MASSVHIFRAKEQPAVRWVDPYLPMRHVFRCHRRALVRTQCCRRKRWAGHCIVHVYYDLIAVFCRLGRGCKRL